MPRRKKVVPPVEETHEETHDENYENYQSSAKQEPITQQEAIAFEINDAPQDAQEGLLSKAFSKLGIKPEKGGGASPKVGKLTATQQRFVDTISPIAASVFVLVAHWVWTLAGQEFAFLAPTDEVASKIMTPLLRIYARNMKAEGTLNPNALDLMASMTALVGYMHASISLYRAAKRGEIELEGPANGRAEPSTRERENRASNEVARSGVITPIVPNHEGIRADGGSRGNSYPHTESTTLSPKEQYSRNKLALLGQLDYETRARRSGQF